MYCRKCGGFIKDNALRCEKCGVDIFPLKKYNTINIMAIVGVIVSIISVFINFYGFPGIAGTIISYLSLKQINRFVQKGRIIAIFGILIGLVSVIYVLII